MGDTCKNQDDANVVVVYLKILMTNPSMGPEDDGMVSLRGYQTQDIGSHSQDDSFSVIGLT